MNEQDLQQQVVQLVQAAMSGDQEASQQIEQIMQAAQQGDQQATQIAQMIQAVAQQIQGQQAKVAKKGAKLAYIKRLRGECPEGSEMQYYKVGGTICKKCVAKQVMQNGGEMPKDPIEAFKCGRKIKKGQGGFETKKPTAKNKVPFTVHDGKGGKKTTYVKDEATRDSLYVNRYNDQELQDTDKGTYQKGKWVPDRKNVYTNNGNIPKKK